MKFATYTRDAATGLDYADQRYYASQFGRFMSADPYMASGGPGDPGSWNRYAYLSNDPINFYDLSGNNEAAPGDGFCPAEFSSCGEWDWVYGGGGGGGGGGGSGAEDVDYANGLISACDPNGRDSGGSSAVAQESQPI